MLKQYQWDCYLQCIFGHDFLNDFLLKLQEVLGNEFMVVVCIHVGLVVIFRVWRDPQALRPIWQGYANTSG